MHVTYEQAEQIIVAAINKAKETGVPSCVAVVDSGANLKVFRRMDDAWVGSIDVAIKKAKTACLFAMPTGDLGKLSQPGGPLYSIEHSNEGLITFPGGLPIVDDLGVLIGHHGEILNAFQYIASLMVGKETQQFIQLIVDVEGHRDRRERQLRQLARRMADQVTKTGRKLSLEPMPAAERRVIHMELRDHPAVTTQSSGEEPHRKITILPK